MKNCQRRDDSPGLCVAGRDLSELLLPQGDELSLRTSSAKTIIPEKEIPKISTAYPILSLNFEKPEPCGPKVPEPRPRNFTVTQKTILINKSQKCLAMIDKLDLFEISLIGTINTLLFGLLAIYYTLYEQIISKMFFIVVLILALLVEIILLWYVEFQKDHKIFRMVIFSHTTLEKDESVPHYRNFLFYIRTLYLFDKSCKLLTLLLTIYYLYTGAARIFSCVFCVLASLPQIFLMFTFQEFNNVKFSYKLLYSSYNFLNFAQ
jgi:hypothetical protein